MLDLITAKAAIIREQCQLAQNFARPIDDRHRRSVFCVGSYPARESSSFVDGQALFAPNAPLYGRSLDVTA